MKRAIWLENHHGVLTSVEDVHKPLRVDCDPGDFPELKAIRPRPLRDDPELHVTGGDDLV
jgi:hypothetical protein